MPDRTISKCSVCTHPRRQAAESLLKEGLSSRRVAKQLNISHSSLARHHANCVVKATRAKELSNPGRLSDPQAELAVLHAETLRIFDIARNSNDHELAFKAIQQTRLNIQLAARMLGVLEPGEEAAKNATLSLQTILRILETHRLGKQEATT